MPNNTLTLHSMHMTWDRALSSEAVHRLRGLQYQVSVSFILRVVQLEHMAEHGYVPKQSADYMPASGFTLL